MTERLILRHWREADRSAFRALNADPSVMRHFERPLTPAQSDALQDRSQAALARRGWGLWATECRACSSFIGFVGVYPIGEEYDFGPAASAAWRVSRSHWGRGLAFEGSQAALEHAFDVAGLPEVVAFTALPNTRSRQLMERLGMTYERDFEHPSVSKEHHLRPHCLYRSTRKTLVAANTSA